MKKILILSGDQNYAASTSSATANTATNAGLLASGAIALYGMVETDAGGDSNDHKLTLITPTDTSTTGNISPANFLAGGGNEVSIVQGYPTFPQQAGVIQAKGVFRIWKQAYTAPVKQVSYIGYNGSTGSLNLPTITANSTGTIGMVQQEVTTSDQIREQSQYTTAPLVASETAYNICLQIVNAINNATSKTHTADIISNGAGTTIAIGGAITGTGAASTQKSSATNGSTTVTITATTLTATTLADGSLITLGGILYKVSGTPDITSNVLTLTLDRAYTGTTYSAVRLDDSTYGVKTVATPTEYGIKLVADTAGYVYNYFKQDVLQDATITYTTGASKGFGTGAAIAAIEEGLMAYRGQMDTASKWAKQLVRFADASATYDVYTISYRNTTVETGVEHNKAANSSMAIAVPVGYDGQANLETILKALFTNAQVNF